MKNPEPVHMPESPKTSTYDFILAEIGVKVNERQS
jgi:hypothetical protein